MTQRRPSSVQLPPVRVEPQLHQALQAIAQEEGRSLSDVVRHYLRDRVAQRLQERAL
jgi:predicted HicB family RNase H-like nuclease